MTTKANFAADEWGRLLASPMVAGIAITAADPSGVWGLIKEGMAGGWALVEARQNAQVNSLVKAVADDFATAEGRASARTALKSRFTGAQFNVLKDNALTELKAVSSFSMLKPPRTQRISKLGCNRLPKRQRRPGMKAASSVSAVLR